MSDTAARQFCTFLVDRLSLAVPVAEVQEVLRYQTMTRVPLTSPVIGGLLNLRGQIVTAVDLRQRLGFAPRPAGRQPMNVVIRSGDDAVSLLVDEIADVVDLSEDLFEKCPDTVPPAIQELLRGAYKTRGRLLLVLDTERAVSLAAPSR